MAHREEKEYILLLVGKTGAGKSTSGNTILGKNLFRTGIRFTGVTDDCEWRVYSDHGRKFKIMDSPGLYDPQKSHQEICTPIVQAVAGMHPGPNAILYVIRIGRYTEEEFRTYQRLKCLFDENITRYMIVLFTGGDELEAEGSSMQQMLDEDSPEQLRLVLNECNNRYVVFNNMASDKQPQVERLLSLIDEMMAEKAHQHYTCPTYTAIGQELEKEVARRLEKQEKEEKLKKCVMNLAKEAEQDAKYTDMLSQHNELERQISFQAEMEKVQGETVTGESIFSKLFCIVSSILAAFFARMTTVADGSIEASKK